MSADIEGATGTVHWNQTDPTNAEYTDFREQITAEVAAACEAVFLGGRAVPLPSRFTLEIVYREHARAYAMSTRAQ